MATENLAAAGSSQGLMQSRSGEYINQDMARQKLAEDKRQDDLNREDKYRQQKLQKAKDEETEIAKFIDFKNPVMPKDEEERVAEASSIVKMIKDKADRKEIEMAKVNFIANDERRKAEYIRAANDLSLANSKPDEYEIVANPFAVASKADYKSKFGSDRYSTEHFIKPNSNIDVTGWITKKTPDFLKQSPQGLNQSKTEIGTSFADEDTRMKWQASTINQMLDGVTPQSRALLKETTNEALNADPELQYYPEELDAVVKQVAANKILKVWDSQKRETKIDNNAPTGGKGLENNITVGGGGENAKWRISPPTEIKIREGAIREVDSKKIVKGKEGKLNDYDYFGIETIATTENPIRISLEGAADVQLNGVLRDKNTGEITMAKVTTKATESNPSQVKFLPITKKSEMTSIRTNIGEDDFDKATATGKYKPVKAAPKKETVQMTFDDYVKAFEKAKGVKASPEIVEKLKIKFISK